jgi:multidrug efflux pump subunit AcrB
VLYLPTLRPVILNAGLDAADKSLPQCTEYQRTEPTLVQILAGNTGLIVFAMAEVLVYLLLGAQYERLPLPLAVILVVPMCLLARSLAWPWRRRTSTSLSRSGSWCWSGWRARTPS